MPNHSAVAVANEFLKLRASDAWPQQTLLQKLVYMAHGWTLAITGQPLVKEAPEAWDNGPVYRTIWNHVRDHGYGRPNCLLVDSDDGKPVAEEMTTEELAIIQHVWSKYEPMGAAKLSELTHQVETPWWSAYFKHYRNAPLSNYDIRNHYLKLAAAGREQRP